MKQGVMAINNDMLQNNEENKVEEHIIGNNEDEEVVGLQVSFYSLCFVYNTIVTGGNDGFLYIWADNQVKKKQTAHPKAPILSLSSQKNSSKELWRLV